MDIRHIYTDFNNGLDIVYKVIILNNIMIFKTVCKDYSEVKKLKKDIMRGKAFHSFCVHYNIKYFINADYPSPSKIINCVDEADNTYLDWSKTMGRIEFRKFLLDERIKNKLEMF